LPSLDPKQFYKSFRSLLLTMPDDLKMNRRTRLKEQT
jgi:hypothetical protein